MILPHERSWGTSSCHSVHSGTPAWAPAVTAAEWTLPIKHNEYKCTLLMTYPLCCKWMLMHTDISFVVFNMFFVFNMFICNMYIYKSTLKSACKKMCTIFIYLTWKVNFRKGWMFNLANLLAILPKQMWLEKQNKNYQLKMRENVSSFFFCVCINMNYNNNNNNNNNNIFCIIVTIIVVIVFLKLYY